MAPARAGTTRPETPPAARFAATRGATGTARTEPRSAPLVRRKAVGPVSFSLYENLPPCGRSRATSHVRSTRRSSVTSFDPRASARTVIVLPWSAGPPGRVSDSVRSSVIQVERSPRPVRSSPPVNVRFPIVVVTTAPELRPASPSTREIARTGVPSRRPLRATTSVTATGPHLCTGEIELHGSSTPTRYGTLLPNAAAAETVRPPEVEWKSVSATLPS